MAPNAIDYSGYPDCRPEYFDQMRQTLRYGSKLGTEYGIQIEIETPIIPDVKGRDRPDGDQAESSLGAHLELLRGRTAALRPLR